MAQWLRTSKSDLWHHPHTKYNSIGTAIYDPKHNCMQSLCTATKNMQAEQIKYANPIKHHKHQVWPKDNKNARNIIHI